eukprot:scaffold55121_cov31-Tisochrysis_lutea.AAC.1
MLLEQKIGHLTASNAIFRPCNDAGVGAWLDVIKITKREDLGLDRAGGRKGPFMGKALGFGLFPDL